MSRPSELKHLEGLPPFLMMQMEARLKVRIREELGLHDEIDPTLPCMSYGGRLMIFEEGVNGLARWMLHRLMEKRMNDGKQFDSILAASTKAFGHMMINNVLRQE